MLNDGGGGGLLSTKGKEHFKQEEQAGAKAKWDQGNVRWFLVMEISWKQWKGGLK